MVRLTLWQWHSEKVALTGFGSLSKSLLIFFLFCFPPTSITSTTRVISLDYYFTFQTSREPEGQPSGEWKECVGEWQGCVGRWEKCIRGWQRWLRGGQRCLRSVGDTTEVGGCVQASPPYGSGICSWQEGGAGSVSASFPPFFFLLL